MLCFSCSEALRALFWTTNTPFRPKAKTAPLRHRCFSALLTRSAFILASRLPISAAHSVPNERLRCADKFDDPNLPGELQATITLKKVSCGTGLNIVQEGVPDVIPAEACYLEWQESFARLAKLVEAEIPD